MTIEQAIEKAIEGGWHATLKHQLEVIREGRAASIFLDPLFWQSLGKALGWKSKKELRARDDDDFEGVRGYSLDIHYYSSGTSKFMDEYLYHWHRFIDHLAEDKSIENYFETLP